MYEQYQDSADFYVVYIAEAHSTDEWQLESNEQENVLIQQHTTMQERLDAARACANGLNLTIPMLVDRMDNAACTLFAAWPERIYILNTDGDVHYKGGHGPFEFYPDEAEKSLKALVGRMS